MRKIGISTACFYPQTVEESLKQVVSLKAPVTEVFMNSFSEMSSSRLRELSKIAKDGGTEIISFHPFISAADHLFLFSGYDFRLDDGIEIYKRFFEAAAFLGAKYLVFHGERIKNEATDRKEKSTLDDQRLFEVYRRLIEAAKEFGVFFAQESVTLFRSENAELLKFLNSSFSDIRFVYDIKQILRAGKDPFEILEAMGEKIVQVHLNNFSDGVCRLPFTDDFGGADLIEIHNRLCSKGYSGDYCIEVYRSNFSSPQELAESAKKAAEKLYGMHFCTNTYERIPPQAVKGKTS